MKKIDNISLLAYSSSRSEFEKTLLHSVNSCIAALSNHTLSQKERDIWIEWFINIGDKLDSADKSHWQTIRHNGKTIGICMQPDSTMLENDKEAYIYYLAAEDKKKISTEELCCLFAASFSPADYKIETINANGIAKVCLYPQKKVVVL